MMTKTTLKPGQKGTKRLMEKYGERLICVHYRYDKQTSRRYTTVELVEEVSDWETPMTRISQPSEFATSRRVAVRVDYWEAELRQQVKTCIWRPRQKLWEMKYKNVIVLGLENRLVGEDEVVPE
ncbi:hypothetical protein ThidrDRAFT_3771 [Thiorhodococcus drewsii AZ1]|uniref:Uncharacterized protein n=1 Tax=Thiorhodococcus drewsii AZ1 TaxID=765913 RepID=G2E658_9GAMM|nr:hypothetical protein [Thiorhodococcus drewsii]EGV28406.1 hypothetical protein ThidrDRAFT_3771 [Thiorhodococcus drewsii AZ1]